MAGLKSLLAPWMGGTSAVPGQTPSIQAGYRSMFVFWMGGGVAGLTPVTPQIITRMPGGGGPDLSDTPDHTVNNNIILLMAIAFMETQ